MISKKFAVVFLSLLLLASLVGAHRVIGKPKKGLMINLPNPDEAMGRNALASWLRPEYKYYIQVQVMTPGGFKTIYLGYSNGELLIPPTMISNIKESWKDVNPAVLIDVWLVKGNTGEAHEIGTFSTRLTDDAIKGLQTFSPYIRNFKANIHPDTATSHSERELTEESFKGDTPIQPARGYFAGYRWRTKKVYLREDDFPNGMYLPVLILDNREGKATVMGMYMVEMKESSSGSSGISIGFSTTIIRGSRLSSRSKLDVENGLQNGEITINIQQGNEFRKSIIDGEVKNVKRGDIGIIAIKGEPYIALQVLQKCYVDEFRHLHCFDTNEERLLITVDDVDRQYNQNSKVYTIRTFSFVNPTKNVYPAKNFEKLIEENAKFQQLAILYGQKQPGRSSIMKVFLDEYDTYSESDIPLLAVAVALQPESWPAFLIGLSAVGSVYITNEKHEKAYGAFAVVNQGLYNSTVVNYATFKYSIKNTNHRTKFLFAYLKFG